jgi:hypothetical protein
MRPHAASCCNVPAHAVLNFTQAVPSHVLTLASCGAGGKVGKTVVGALSFGCSSLGLSGGIRSEAAF